MLDSLIYIFFTYLIYGFLHSIFHGFFLIFFVWKWFPFVWYIYPPPLRWNLKMDEKWLLCVALLNFIFHFPFFCNCQRVFNQEILDKSRLKYKKKYNLKTYDTLCHQFKKNKCFLKKIWGQFQWNWHSDNVITDQFVAM